MYWPAYSPPFEDELLSSWIFRNALEHKIKPYSFTKFYLGNYNFWARDSDKYLPHEIVSKISQSTPLTINQIKNLQLTAYENLLFLGDIVPSHTIGLTSAGIYHRKRKNNALLVCPKCLSKQSYFKKSWRILTTLVCTECKSYLLESCPRCYKPIIFHRLEIGDKSNFFENPMYLCYNCYFDLRSVNIPVTNNRLLQYQNYIDATLRRGFNQHSQYSFLYFETLLTLFNRLTGRSVYLEKFQNAVITEYNLYNFRRKEHSFIMDYELRLNYFPVIFDLMSNYPNKINLFFKKYDIRYTDVVRETKPVPYILFQSFRCK